MTKKARFIKKLAMLTYDEKTKAINFFNNYPVYEKYIDWNNKDLCYIDFEALFSLAKTSIREMKRKFKTDPASLFEKYNCKIISLSKEFLIAIPLDWGCVKFFNSFACGGEGAKWCICDKRAWDMQFDIKSMFYFIYFFEKNPFFGKKIMVEYNVRGGLFVWLQNDKLINPGILGIYLRQNYHICYEYKNDKQLFLDFDNVIINKKIITEDSYLLRLLEKSFEYIDKVDLDY
jgi:hypothetical protein